MSYPMKKDHTTKLAAVEASMARWQTRLTRATNALNKLAKQRRRLLAQTAVSRMTAKPGELTPNQKEALAQAPKVSVETDHISDLDLPAFLDRRNPDGIRKAAREMQEAADAQLVDRLKAQRADQVAADKKKMPLTGRAAMDYLKVTPKKKKAKPGSAAIQQR